MPVTARMRKTRTGRVHTRRLHEQRTCAKPPPDPTSPALSKAWHELQLRWLATVPGYRETLRARVQEAASERAQLADGTCRRCGVDLPQDEQWRRRKFCSTQCRQTWWNAYVRPSVGRAIAEQDRREEQSTRLAGY